MPIEITASGLRHGKKYQVKVEVPVGVFCMKRSRDASCRQINRRYLVWCDAWQKELRYTAGSVRKDQKCLDACKQEKTK